MTTGESIHNHKSDTGAIRLKEKLRSSDKKTVDSKHFQFNESFEFETDLAIKIDYIHFKNQWQLQIFTVVLLSNDLKTFTNADEQSCSNKNQTFFN